LFKEEEVILSVCLENKGCTKGLSKEKEVELSVCFKEKGWR
jgi:hypothetical protein